jgi:hypothetical protein
VPPRDLAEPTATFMIIGGGVAVAAAQLAFTAVLLVLHARIRRLGPPTAAGPGVVANVAPGAAYPPATGSRYPVQTAPMPPPAPPAR